MLQRIRTAALLGMSLLAALSQVYGQTADHKTALGVHANLTQYRGDLGSSIWQWKNMPYSRGIDLHRYVGKALDLQIDLDFTRLRFPAKKATFTSTGQRFSTQLYTGGLGLKFKAPFKDDFFLHPYVLLQPGFSLVLAERYASSTASNNFTRFGAFDGHVAAGIDFHLGPITTLFVQMGQRYLLTDDARLDGSDLNSSGFWDKHDRYMQFQVGLRGSFGQLKDTDADGVPDSKDKCLETPVDAKVDAHGCPVDTDGDGVANYQDKCPDVAGLASRQGCPDADADGVADAEDHCPNTPAGVRVDASGCPLDADADKVPDNLDQCPNTPAGVSVDAKGCPLDRDGDGVSDDQDPCPDRPGPASNKGCPEIKVEQKKVLNEATKYIQFDYNKATLKTSSYARLDQLVAILNEYPDYSLSIAGHTDSKGPDEYNRRLSYERAASARVYMLSKGIPAERIEARGYGETKPLADNAAAAGQAQNRRVDFDSYLTGEANAAEVKYGPAPTLQQLPQQGKKGPTKATPAKKAQAKKKPATKR